MQDKMDDRKPDIDVTRLSATDAETTAELETGEKRTPAPGKIEKKVANKKAIQKTSPAKKSARKKKRGPRQSPLFVVMSAIAMLAILALALYTFAPEFLRRTFYSSPLDRQEWVMRVGDFEVSYDEYIFTAMQRKTNGQSTYGEYYWEKNPAAEAQALDELREYFIMMGAELALAQELGIVITDADRTEIQAEMESLKEGKGAEWQDYLNSYSMDENLYLELMYRNWIFSKVSEALLAPDSEYVQNITDEERLAVIDEQGLLGAKHILILSVEDEAENVEKLALAEEILARIQAGEDFDELMMTYSEDNPESNPDGYTFKSGEFVSEFEDAVLALDYGEMSGIVQSDYGYHIILRVMPDVDDDVVDARIDAKLDELGESLPVSYNRGFERIRMKQVVWTAPVAEDAEPAEGDQAADADDTNAPDDTEAGN